MNNTIQKYSVYKHPDSDLDFGRNWGDDPDTGVAGWLHSDEIIINSSWSITSKEEDEITLIEAEQGTSISLDGKITSIFLKGGTSGIEYNLSNSIITTDNNGVVRRETKEALLTCKKGC